MGDDTTPRIDSASRLIRADAATIWAALVDPEAMQVWRPPKGMTCRVGRFEPWPGGAIEMVLSYDRPDTLTRGKSSAGSDAVRGRFVDLAPGRRVVEAVRFASDDPGFGGEMTVTTVLTPVRGGTEVSIACTDVPDGIRPEDHRTGIASTLENLAAFVERRPQGVAHGPSVI